MRWLTSCCIAVLTAHGAMVVPTRADLVGSWLFDDNSGTQLTDSSGRDNHGTLVNGPAWVSGRTGNAGDYALSFNGTNHVSLGQPDDLQIIWDQTISMWVYPTTFASRQNPYAKAYGGTGTITQETDGPGKLTYYHGKSGRNAPPYYQFRPDDTLTLNAWNHIAVVRELTSSTPEIRWYINGVESTHAVPAAYIPAAADETGQTAYFAEGYAGNYRGSIDDAQIYNVALSKQEANWLRNHTGGVPMWDGSAGTWSTATRWSTGAVPDMTGPDTARIESGTVTHAASGDFVVDGGTSFNLAGNGTWIKGSGGSLVVGQSGEGTVNQIGGTLDASQADNVRLGDGAAAVGNYHLNGGTLIVSSMDQGAGSANFNVDGGTLQAAADFSTSLPITVDARGATVDTGGNDVTLSGDLTAGSGSGSLTKTGSGKLTLEGKLDYTGGTTVEEGTLALNGGGTLSYGNLGQFGSSGQTLTVDSGATLQFTKAWTTGDGRHLQLVANGGTIHFLNSPNYQSFITLTGGHINASGDSYAWRTGNYNTNALITVNASDTSSTIDGVLCFVDDGAPSLTTTFDVADGAAVDDLIVSSNILDHFPSTTYGGMTLVKAGAGKMILSGTNSYVGETAVDAGILMMNGTHTDGGTYTVAAGATLGGSGTIDASVALAGTISPGASVGTFATGAQTWEPGSVFNFEIDNATGEAGREAVLGGGWDLLDIEGALSLSNPAAGAFEIDIVSLQPGGGTTPGDAANFSAAPGSTYVWEFLQTTDPIAAFDPSWFALDTSGFSNSVANFYGLGEFGVIQVSDYALAITFTAAVPEPSSVLLALLGLVGLVGFRRPRR